MGLGACTKATGRMTGDMGRVMRGFVMVMSILVTLSKAESKARESASGSRQVKFTKVSGTRG